MNPFVFISWKVIFIDKETLFDAASYKMRCNVAENKYLSSQFCTMAALSLFTWELGSVSIRMSTRFSGLSIECWYYEINVLL